MREAETLGRHLVVEGVTGIKVEDIDAFFDLVKDETKGCHVQFFDASMVAGFEHLYFAVLNALKAFTSGTNISKNLSVETLLYASGQHQISKAIELLGMKRGSSEIAILVVADERGQTLEALERILLRLQGERSDEIIDLTDEKVEMIKAAFGIKDSEIEATLRDSRKEALTSLLIERAALLATLA